MSLAVLCVRVYLWHMFCKSKFYIQAKKQEYEVYTIILLLWKKKKKVSLTSLPLGEKSHGHVVETRQISECPYCPN